MEEFEKKEEEEEWESVVESEFEHNLNLLGNIHKLKDDAFENVFSFTQNLLALSNISSELSELYALRLECAKEWFTLGMKNLALKRASFVYDRLMINRSVTGFERMLQGGKPIIRVGTKLRTGERGEIITEEENEEEHDFLEKIKKRV